jgi:hypothetical protein
MAIDLIYGVLWSRLLSGAPPSAPDYASELIALLRPCLERRG